MPLSRVEICLALDLADALPSGYVVQVGAGELTIAPPFGGTYHAYFRHTQPVDLLAQVLRWVLAGHPRRYEVLQ